MIPYSLNPLGVDVYDDLYWLRKIRDANPTSQLPSLWLDSEDPYTQWFGVTWYEANTKVINLAITAIDINDLSNVNKLTSLTHLYCNSNQLTSLDVTGLSNLQVLYCNSNQLNNISTLTSRQNINVGDASFDSNKFNSIEINRLLSIGFTAEEIGTQNP